MKGRIVLGSCDPTRNEGVKCKRVIELQIANRLGNSANEKWGRR